MSDWADIEADLAGLTLHGKPAAVTPVRQVSRQSRAWDDSYVVVKSTRNAGETARADNRNRKRRRG